MPYYLPYYLTSSPAEIAANTAFSFVATASLEVTGGPSFTYKAFDLVPLAVETTDQIPLDITSQDSSPLVVTSGVESA